MSARKCWNIKSRKHPDVPCTRSTYQDAEYCSLHYKNPRPFSKPCDTDLLRPKQKARLRRFFSLCKIVQGLVQTRRQGYGITDPTLANNPTELISMESTDTIPIYFRFSILEDNRLWLFDIRSLAAERRRAADSKAGFKNPYTSIQFDRSVSDRLEDCLAWLETRSYPSQTDLTVTHDSYEQKMVELCYLIDSYGYLTNIHWFTHMHTVNVNQFIAIPPILRETNLVACLLRSVAEHLPKDNLVYQPLPVGGRSVPIVMVWNSVRENNQANLWMRKKLIQACEHLRKAAVAEASPSELGSAPYSSTRNAE